MILVIFLVSSFTQSISNPKTTKAAGSAPPQNLVVYTSSYEDYDLRCSATMTWDKVDLNALKAAVGPSARLDKVQYVPSYTAANKDAGVGTSEKSDPLNYRLWWKPTSVLCDVSYVFRVEAYYGNVGAEGTIYLGSSLVNYALKREDGVLGAPIGKCPPLNIVGRLERNASIGIVYHIPWIKWNINTAPGCPRANSVAYIIKSDSGTWRKEPTRNDVHSGKLDPINKVTTYTITTFDIQANTNDPTKALGSASITFDPSRPGTFATGVTGGDNSSVINPVPTTPTLTGTVQNTTVKLSWNDVKSSCKNVTNTRYQVWRDDVYDPTGISGTTYTDALSGGEEAKKHTYYVKAICEYGTSPNLAKTESGNSNKIEYTPPSAPGQPGTVKDIGGATEAPGGADPNADPSESGQGQKCKSACSTNRIGLLSPSGVIRDAICNIQCTILEWMGDIVGAMIYKVLIPAAI